MKYANEVKLFAASAALLLTVATPKSLMAQKPATTDPVVAPSPAPPTLSQDPAAKNRPRTTGTKTKTEPVTPAVDQTGKPNPTNDIPADMQANRQEVSSEENAIVPYY